MNKPRILIPVPTSFDEAYNGQCWPEYASAVRFAGGEPVEVSLQLGAAELEALVHSAQGILLPGSGADIEPSRYGHVRHPASAPADLSRELADRALLGAAERTRTPVLGICFGLQSINVFYGGTLVQDVNPMPVNHRAGRSVAAAHGATLTAETRLEKALHRAGRDRGASNPARSLMVNSSHHQAIGIPGDALRVAATCPGDGVIEALEGTAPDHWLVGVQWHPERTLEGAGSQELFGAFLTAAAQTWPR